MPRIAVLGAGAIGSSLAADLIQAGHTPVVVDQWAAHVETVQQHGLRVQMPTGDLHARPDMIHVSDVQSRTTRFDIVFVAVKAYDTRWSCALIEPHLAADGVVVGVQNALTLSDVARTVGGHRAIGCVPELAAELFEPGLVRRATPHANAGFRIGTTDDAAAGRLDEVAALLAHTGQVTRSSDIEAAKWSKLVLNAMLLGPPAFVGLSAAAAGALPGMRDLFRRVGREALAIGARRGQPMEPIMGLGPDDLADDEALLEKLIAKVADDDRFGGLANCVLQDHLKGRYSEVDLINGYLVTEGERLGISTPANLAVVETTREIFTGALRPEPANLDRVSS